MKNANLPQSNQLAHFAPINTRVLIWCSVLAVLLLTAAYALSVNPGPDPSTILASLVLP
jgi:hypothetical protein